MDVYQRMEELMDALEAAREAGDRAAEASALHEIGRVYFRDRVFEAAVDFWERCENVCRETDQDLELARVLVDLGDLALETDDPDRAEARYGEALALCRHPDRASDRARILERIGSLALKRDRAEAALAVFGQGFELCRENQDRIGGMFFLDQIIPLLKARGDADATRLAYREQISLAEALGDRERMALSLVGLAELYGEDRRIDEAIPHLKMAHDLYLRLGKEKEAALIRGEIDRLDDSPSGT